MTNLTPSEIQIMHRDAYRMVNQIESLIACFRGTLGSRETHYAMAMDHLGEALLEADIELRRIIMIAADQHVTVPETYRQERAIPDALKGKTYDATFPCGE